MVAERRMAMAARISGQVNVNKNGRWEMGDMDAIF
jgi:hypothetical protein